MSDGREEREYEKYKREQQNKEQDRRDYPQPDDEREGRPERGGS